MRRFPQYLLTAMTVMFSVTSGIGEDLPRKSGSSEELPVCRIGAENFEQEVWAKVIERSCLRCHHEGGDARDSRLLLNRPAHFAVSFADTPEESGRVPESRDWMALNRSVFESLAGIREPFADGTESLVLLKATGRVEHGGGAVLKTESTAFRILQDYIRLLDTSETATREMTATDPGMPGAGNDLMSGAERRFFHDVILLSPARRLRRVTLSLAGRLPTEDELQEVRDNGDPAVSQILERVFTEDAFYDRLREAFNDIFLTLGVEDNAETLLSYHHFEKTRLWYQKHDFSHLPEAERERAGWKLADIYREALLQEPLRLIEYIVRNDRPFTELVTADYIMVSPYSARGYGIFDSVRDQFRNPEDPFEYIPAKLPALVGRDGKTQESKTGLYPHAGFLSMFHYLRRYPSTETNRNRLRARMVYQHFLGVDIMQLAPRSTDASAVAEQYEIPTLQAPDCVVCHRTIDPVAGIFQDFDFEGHVIPRKGGWYNDMFAAGYDDEDLPAEERWRAPQWLAERLIQDPRFAVAMVEHVYYILFGRRVLQAPDDIDDPLFSARRRAFLAQRAMIEQAAMRFKVSGYNLKVAFRELIESDFYRADGLQTVSADPERMAELDDVGLVRLLSPEQLERRLTAVFGEPWGRLEGETKILYGGIDSIAITERNADPSGAMGAIQRILANDVACRQVALDFRRPAAERRLFMTIEPSVVPGDPMSDQQIRHTIVVLHERLLGLELTPEDAEVERIFRLFTSIMQEAGEHGRFESRETWYCGGRDEFRTDDPLYTIRAWRAVVTCLLRQHSFLYE